MKREYIIGVSSFLIFAVVASSVVISYYYKMKELARVATQRHRAAAMDEKRAMRAWDKARENRKAAENFYADSYKLREEANHLVEQAIALVKERV